MIFSSLIAHIARVRANAAAVRQLNGLTDHQLNDLGISRDQIDAVVYGQAETLAKPAHTVRLRRPVFTMREAMRA